MKIKYLLIVLILVGCGKTLEKDDYPEFVLNVGEISTVTGSADGYETRKATGTIAQKDGKIVFKLGGEYDGEYNINSCKQRGESALCRTSLGTLRIPYNDEVKSITLEKSTYGLIFSQKR